MSPSRPVRVGWAMQYCKNLDTAGFDLDFQRFRADYVWVPMGELRHTHRFSVALRS